MSNISAVYFCTSVQALANIYGDKKKKGGSDRELFQFNPIGRSLDNHTNIHRISILLNLGLTLVK